MKRSGRADRLRPQKENRSADERQLRYADARAVAVPLTSLNRAVVVVGNHDDSPGFLDLLILLNRVLARLRRTK
jgi:hypothetical protein